MAGARGCRGVRGGGGGGPGSPSLYVPAPSPCGLNRSSRPGPPGGPPGLTSPTWKGTKNSWGWGHLRPSPPFCCRNIGCGSRPGGPGAEAGGRVWKSLSRQDEAGRRGARVSFHLRGCAAVWPTRGNSLSPGALTRACPVYPVPSPGPRCPRSKGLAQLLIRANADTLTSLGSFPN